MHTYSHYAGADCVWVYSNVVRTLKGELSMWSIFKKTKKVYRNREQVLREEGYTREDGSNLSPDGRILLNGPTEVDCCYEIPDGVRIIFSSCFSKTKGKIGKQFKVIVPKSAVYICKGAFANDYIKEVEYK